MTKINAKETVLLFLDALNSEDFEEARKYLEDDMKFIGVMGERDSADAYMGDMKKMKFKYEIKKALSEGDDVAAFYDINMGKQTIFSSGWYHVENGKIKWFKVLFDPRPLLEYDEKD
ncbi:MAG: nuclear transport factor 2 family protein [Bacteroidetes bacterium]|nr:nuclear transport factor 2 family protein [Bacteroidota bacterium]